jgi:hypothetical protein
VGEAIVNSTLLGFWTHQLLLLLLTSGVCTSTALFEKRQSARRLSNRNAKERLIVCLEH